MLYTGIGGAYIFTNFAVSHSHLPVVEEGKHLTWVEYAANHTVNCTNHFFVNWWMAYLNFQIEHHLFPSVPQFRFPSLSVRVKQFFAENGLHYDCRGYFEALSATFKNLQTVGTSK
jgi:fatty acid desaturase 2 (delta-6 desaturase)